MVAAASQGPSALIREGDDGLLVPIDDPEALAGGVRRLLADPALRKRLSAAGTARVTAEFSEAAVVGQWKSLFADFGAA